MGPAFGQPHFFREGGKMANKCNSCPRNCGAERPKGFCRAPSEFLVSRVALHPYEEPPISGDKGSGTIFFGGCNLGCVYCQNKAISRGGRGEIMSGDRLEAAMLSLCEQGAHNINLVTPSHYFSELAPLLERVKPKLGVPIVCNCGGYESVDALKRLEGLVDVYLPDFKYFSAEISAKYSFAPDYFDVASRAIAEMSRQQPKLLFEDGLLKKGLVIRHLVLPGCRKDSMRVLDELSELLSGRQFLLSLMSQYTPDFVDEEKFPELGRPVTTFEYNSVMSHAEKLGFEGFFQARSSVGKKYTPEF